MVTAGVYQQNTGPRVPNLSIKSTAVRFIAHFVVEKPKIDFSNQICISGCRDSDLFFEHNNSTTFTLVRLSLYMICIFIERSYHIFQAIVELLKVNPKASFKDVIYATHR